MSEEQQPNRPIWEAESTHPEIAAKLHEAFSQIFDPEIGLNIIQLGLIRNVKVTDEDVQIMMILTTPFCPYGPSMIETIRVSAVEAIDKPVYLSLGNEVWDFSMMEEGLGQDWGLY
jgi:metal-sulfur cluster biosynthetic enzyme